MGHNNMGNASNQLAHLMQMQQAAMQNLMTGGIGGGLSPAHLRGIAGIEAPTIPAGIDVKQLELLKKVEPRAVGRRMPDGLTPITAWRVWSVINQKLSAIGSTGTWEPKKRMEAICNNGAQHPAPQSACNCGMWAFKTLDGLVAATKPYTVKVLGQVSLWGRVIETENGFRAQYAYPKELWLLDSSLEELGYIYGVPVRTA